MPSDVVLLFVVGGEGIWLALVLGCPIRLADLFKLVLLDLRAIDAVDFVRCGVGDSFVDAIGDRVALEEEGAGICVARLANPICDTDREGKRVVDDNVGFASTAVLSDMLETSDGFLEQVKRLLVLLDSDFVREGLDIKDEWLVLAVEWLLMDDVDVDALGYTFWCKVLRFAVVIVDCELELLSLLKLPDLSDLYR